VEGEERKEGREREGKKGELGGPQSEFLATPLTSD